MSRFEGKVALVTGGRSGIGRAIVQRLQAEGARVLTAQRKLDPHTESIKADLADPSSVLRVMADVERRASRLDVLVNNAGVMRESSLENLSLEDWQQHLAVNLTAPLLLAQAALPLLRLSSGNIVNVGSIEGLGANPQHAAYCASKAGLHGLTRSLAVDLGADGIRCNAVAPGWIDTELNNAFVEGQPDPTAFRRDIGSIHPLGRTGQAEEVAALVAFLASGDSAFITGQIMTVDGGRMVKLSLPRSS